MSEQQIILLTGLVRFNHLCVSLSMNMTTGIFLRPCSVPLAMIFITELIIILCTKFLNFIICLHFTNVKQDHKNSLNVLSPVPKHSF